MKPLSGEPSPMSPATTTLFMSAVLPTLSSPTTDSPSSSPSLTTSPSSSSPPPSVAGRTAAPTPIVVSSLPSRPSPSCPIGWDSLLPSSLQLTEKSLKCCLIQLKI